MAASEATQILDELLDVLETAAGKVGDNDDRSNDRDGQSQRPKDAIDAVLARPPRTTAVSSLRDSPEVAAFREALVDGLIRVDTANRLLRLLNEVVVRLLA